MVNLVLFLEPSPNGQTTFEAGEVIKGTVELSLNEEKKVRGCYVLVYGRAKTHWSEKRTRTEGTGDNKRTEQYDVKFSGQQVFLNSKTYIFGYDGASATPLPPGVHRYSFACQLPLGLPYSATVPNGEISYCVEACLDIPWQFDKEMIRPITVVSKDDLNKQPHLRMGQKMDRTKRFCCLFCRSRPLFMTASIPCSGFAVGHDIPVSIVYKNDSNVAVEHTKVKLNRVITCTANVPETKTKVDYKTIVETFASGAQQNQALELTSTLIVPKSSFNSTSATSKIIRVEYFVRVEAVVGGCYMPPAVIEFPVTIGSVPIQYLEGAPVSTTPQLPSVPAERQQLLMPSTGYAPYPSAPVGGFGRSSEMVSTPSSISQKTSTSAGWNFNVSTSSAPQEHPNFIQQSKTA